MASEVDCRVTDPGINPSTSPDPDTAITTPSTSTTTSAATAMTTTTETETDTTTTTITTTSATATGTATATTTTKTLTPETPPPGPSLHTLPPELLLLITTHLPYATLALTLPATCKRLHITLNPDTFNRPLFEKLNLYDHADQHYPQHINRLACFTCFRFLGKDKFADGQRTGERGKFGLCGWKRRERFCFECGVQGRRYAHLRGVRWNGQRWYPCHRCGVARLGSQRCLREVCVVGDGDMQQLGGDSRLEGLPREVVERVCGWLGYEDLLRLKRVSRFFRGVVEPVRQCRDVYGMWEFVMRVIQRRQPLGGHEAPRACFGCFRVREKKQFSPQQYRLSRKYNQGEYWRRRCWECLRRFYHPQLADVEARARFHRQVLCGVCKCLRYADEDCHGCVARSAQIAEWARLRELRGKKRMPGSEWMADADVIVPSWLDEEVTTTEPEEAEVPQTERVVETEPCKGAAKGRNRLVTWVALILRLKRRIRETKAGGLLPPDVDDIGGGGTTPGPSSAPLALAV